MPGPRQECAAGLTAPKGSVLSSDCVSYYCSKTANSSVRLASPAFVEEGASRVCGRVEIKAPGQSEWGTICHVTADDDPTAIKGSTWDDAAAAVTCRQLGLTNGTAKFVGSVALEPPPPDSGIAVPDYYFEVCGSTQSSRHEVLHTRRRMVEVYSSRSDLLCLSVCLSVCVLVCHQASRAWRGGYARKGCGSVFCLPCQSCSLPTRAAHIVSLILPHIA